MMDASPAGYGVMSRSTSSEEVEQTGRFDERWTFKKEYRAELGARATALAQADPFLVMDTVLPMHSPPTCVWAKRRKFSEVPVSFLNKDCWHEVLSGVGRIVRPFTCWRGELVYWVCAGRAGV